MESKIKSWTLGYEALLLKVTSHPSNITDIAEIKSFYQKYEGVDDYDAIKFSCEGLIAIILDHNGFYVEASEIYLRLLPQKSPEEFAFTAMIGAAAEVAERVDRIDEVMPYITSFLKISEHTEAKNDLLRWYVRIFPEAEKEFLYLYGNEIVTMAAETGIEDDRTIPFTDFYRFLSAEIIRAEHNYSQLFESLNEAVVSNRTGIFEQYMVTEPLQYYKEKAKRIFEFQQKRLQRD